MSDDDPLNGLPNPLCSTGCNIPMKLQDENVPEVPGARAWVCPKCGFGFWAKPKVKEIRMKLNLGCGRNHLEGYINIDILGGEIKAAAENLPFKNEIFDEIFASHVLEHVAHLRKSMHEIHRVLRNDGYLVIRVPYGLKSLYDPDHLRAFDETTFESFGDRRKGEVCCQEIHGLFHIEKLHVTKGLPFGIFIPGYHMMQTFFPKLRRWIDSDCRQMDFHFGFKREIVAILRRCPT